MAEKHIRLKSVYKRDMRDQRRGMVKAIMKVMEDKGEIHLTAEEHAAFVQCLRLSRKLDDMERLQLYFRGHTDAVAYLKKIKAI